MVVWYHEDYIAEAGKKLNNEIVYKSVKFKDKIMAFLKILSREATEITEKQLKYFTTELKKDTNLEEMSLLYRIHEKLYDVPGRPVISNCETPTEKTSELLDNQLKEVKQNGWSYIKDSNDSIKKIKHLKNIPF